MGKKIRPVPPRASGVSKGDQPPQAEEVILETGTPLVVAERATRMEGVYAMAGLIAGGLMVLAGVVVLILGVSGAVDWSFQLGSLSSHVQTSLAGIVIAIIGLLVIVITRFRVTTRK